MRLMARSIASCSLKSPSKALWLLDRTAVDRLSRSVVSQPIVRICIQPECHCIASERVASSLRFVASHQLSIAASRRLKFDQSISTTATPSRVASPFNLLPTLIASHRGIIKTQWHQSHPRQRPAAPQSSLAQLANKPSQPSNRTSRTADSPLSSRNKSVMRAVDQQSRRPQFARQPPLRLC